MSSGVHRDRQQEHDFKCQAFHEEFRWYSCRIWIEYVVTALRDDSVQCGPAGLKEYEATYRKMTVIYHLSNREKYEVLPKRTNQF